MCSGQHTVFLLLSRLNGWDPTDYWKAEPPVADRLPRGRRGGLRHLSAQAPDGDRRLRHRHLCVPPARGRPRVRDAGGPGRGPGRRSALRAGRVADEDPRRHARQPRDGRRPARPDRHLAHEGGTWTRGQQGRDGGPARPRDPARHADRHERRVRVRDGHQGRGRRRLRARARGRRRSRRSVRPACSTAARCATSPGTTGRRSSIRTGASAPRRSPNSSSHPWASSSADDGRDRRCGHGAR